MTGLLFFAEITCVNSLGKTLKNGILIKPHMTTVTKAAYMRHATSDDGRLNLPRVNSAKITKE